MCGIAGVFEYEGRKRVESDILPSMLDSIEHRGPDDRGMMQRRNFAMGMQRLSIIDLPGGKQPISNEDGNLTIVFNGEIYNYRELREQLIAKGHKFSSLSDTEVIIHLFEDLGESCVDRLRGMFSFAIWDANRQSLFIARDRLGIKPLYYLNKGGCLLFASEIKAILTYPDVDATLNIQSLGHYLSLKYVPSPLTMFEGIVSLPPGYSLRCDKDGPSVKRYWDLSFEGCVSGVTEDEWAERLEAVLRESVALHLVSDVPFGAFLSGGVDSSLIVALMSTILNKTVKTFSVGFRGSGAEKFSELPFARIVAEQFETEHHEVFVTPDDLINFAGKVIWHCDQPIADNACVANYMVSKLASQHVKVALTGEGGDELFGGYARYAGEQFSSLVSAVPSPLSSAAMSFANWLPGMRRPKAAMLALTQRDEISRMTSWFPLFNRTRKPNLLTRELFSEMSDPFSEAVFKHALEGTSTKDRLSRMLYVDTKLWLPDDLLARGDKTSMATSLEGRVPLLDHKVVEFASGIPSNLKVKRLVRKFLLKKVARKWLSPAIIDRKKEGFPMPFSLWFRKECRPFVHDLLSTQTIKRRGLFNPQYVQELLKEHDSGNFDHGNLIWGLVSLELWQQAYMDHPVKNRG